MLVGGVRPDDAARATGQLFDRLPAQVHENLLGPRVVVEPKPSPGRDRDFLELGDGVAPVVDLRVRQEYRPLSGGASLDHVQETVDVRLEPEPDPFSRPERGVRVDLERGPARFPAEHAVSDARLAAGTC